MVCNFKNPKILAIILSLKNPKILERIVIPPTPAKDLTKFIIVVSLSNTND